MYDVITVGSATVDVFAHTDRSELIKIMTKEGEQDLLAYPSGTKLVLTKLDFTTGGGGTNTAVALRRLGLRTAFLGHIGSGNNGDQVIKRLKDDMVDFIGCRGKEHTGFSIILDSIEHDRTILTYKGANDAFDFDCLDKARISAKWLYATAMVSRAYRHLVRLIAFAKKKDMRVMFNPSCYLAEQGLRKLKLVLQHTDILVLNREEAALLVGQGGPEQLVARLLRHVPLAIVTDGSNGSFAGDRQHFFRARSHHLRVVETTGAGDAFGSSFLAGYIREKDISFALGLATTNAESVITHHGAKNRLLTWNDALRLMKKRRVHVTQKKIDWKRFL